MNKDAWEDLDTWERRAHEPIKDYLNEAPVKLGERELKLKWIIFDDGLRITDWEDSWITPDRSKRILTIKTITRGWQHARITNLEENGARLKRNSSSVFKRCEWHRETPPIIIEAHRKNQKRRGWANYEKNLKDLGERHLTDDNSFLR